MAAPSACEARQPRLCTNTRFGQEANSSVSAILEICLRGRATTGGSSRGEPIERKVRSSKGSMPANGRGFALKVHATDQCHRKYTACRSPAE